MKARLIVSDGVVLNVFQLMGMAHAVGEFIEARDLSDAELAKVRIRITQPDTPDQFDFDISLDGLRF